MPLLDASHVTTAALGNVLISNFDFIHYTAHEWKYRLLPNY